MKSLVITIVVIVVGVGLIIWLYTAAQAITAGIINMKKKLKGGSSNGQEKE